MIRILWYFLLFLIIIPWVDKKQHSHPYFYNYPKSLKHKTGKIINLLQMKGYFAIYSLNSKVFYEEGMKEITNPISSAYKNPLTDYLFHHVFQDKNELCGFTPYIPQDKHNQKQEPTIAIFVDRIPHEIEEDYIFNDIYLKTVFRGYLMMKAYMSNDKLTYKQCEDISNDTFNMEWESLKLGNPNFKKEYEKLCIPAGKNKKD